MLLHLLFKLSVFFLELVDEAQFPADKPLDEWFLNVVSAVDGLEESFQKFRKFSFVEGFHGCHVLDIGLCLFHGPFKGLVVIETLGKADDFRADKYIGR